MRVIFLLFALIFSACASKPEQGQKAKAKNDYYDAMRSFDSGNFTVALRKFEEISKKYSLNYIARDSLIMEVFLNYVNGKYDEAYHLGDMYAQLYPSDRDKVEYCRYIQALAKMKMIKDYRTSSNLAIEALGVMQKFALQYKGTKYGGIIEQRILGIDEFIAISLTDVGDQYLRKNNCIAALENYYVARKYLKNGAEYKNLHIRDLDSRINACTKKLILS